MKRAALEAARTKSVWRAHLRGHALPVRCACEFQKGRFRKGQRVGGCGNARCWLCHADKLGRVPTRRMRRALARYVEGLREVEAR